jgi:hypothetical protein
MTGNILNGTKVRNPANGLIVFKQCSECLDADLYSAVEILPVPECKCIIDPENLENVIDAKKEFRIILVAAVEEGICARNEAQVGAANQRYLVG